MKVTIEEVGGRPFRLGLKPENDKDHMFLIQVVEPEEKLNEVFQFEPIEGATIERATRYIKSVVRNWKKGELSFPPLGECREGGS